MRILSRFALGWAVAAPLLAQTRVAPEVEHLRYSGGSLAVLVTLREQPQREIAARMEGAGRLHLDLAEANWRQAEQRLVVSASEVESAREQVEAVILKTRRAAFQEIAARIRPSQESVRARLESVGASQIRTFAVVNALAATLPATSLDAVAAHPDVMWISLAPEVKASLDVSVPTIGTAAFWNRGGTGGSEAVAIMDSGIRTSHPAFAGRKLTSKVFSDGFRLSLCFDDVADSVEDKHGHGTHVAGIVGSGGSPQFSALQGVARGLGSLIVLKTLFLSKLIPGQCTGGATGNGLDILSAFDWAMANTPARIFNFSFGGLTNTDDGGLAPIFDFAVDALNVTLAVAAGNEGPGAGTLGSPGIAHNVISVANFDDRNTVDRADDGIADSSSRGPTPAGRAKPDVAAPGTRIRSAAFDSDGFVELTGTSMAAPHVAGAAALLYQAGLNHPLSVRALLINSADGAGWRPDMGWGAINLARAQPGVANVVRGAVGAGAAKFYRGRIGSDFKATLVWNRHVDFSGQAMQSALNNLNLELFNRLDGSTLDKSDSTVNNLEQVRTSIRGEALLKLSARDAQFRGGVGQEAYALAVSESGFVEVAPPLLTAACGAPAAVAPGGSFAVSCQVRNAGGLDAVATSAALTLPAAFRAVAPVNVGTIAAAGTAPALFTLAAPAAAGDYTIAVNLTSNAFGESFRASASVTVRVAVPVLPQMTFAPLTLDFTFRTGGAVPAAQTVDLRIAATGINFTAVASSNGNWLTVTPSSAALPASLRAAVSPQSLAPGVYNGSIAVSAAGTANTPLTIPVSIRVEAPSPARLAERMTTKSVPEACALPTAASAFLPTEARAFVWFQMTGAARGDRANVTWTGPDGIVYQTGAWQPLETGGNFCFSSALSLAGTAASAKTGNWQVSVTWNGADLFSLPFTVGTPVTVRKSVLATSVDLENVCTEPAASERLFTTDREAYLWFILDRSKGGEALRYEFLSPSRRVAQSGRWNPIASAGSWCFRTSALRIADTIIAAQPGTWTVNVFIDDELMFTFPFELVKGFTVENRMLTKSVGESGCSEPDPHGGFYRGDQRAIFWFQVSNPAEGDLPATEWIAPSGEVYTTIAWDPVPSSGGSRCYWAWIDIADNVPAARLGEWKVRLKWNGEVLSTTPFHILSVEIANRMTTPGLPEGAGCPTPTPAALYATTDESVTLWFLVRQASVGDAPRVEWFGPDGRVAFRSAWAPLTRAGNFCFTSTLRIAGNTPANVPGEWVARVFWNEAFLFNQTFVVRAPQGGSGGSGGTVTARMFDAEAPETRLADAGALGPPEIGITLPRRRGNGFAEREGSFRRVVSSERRQ